MGLVSYFSGLFSRNKPQVECPLCGYRGRILKKGGKVGKCPQCTTYARHRLAAFWLQDSLDSATTISLLHVAPEPGLKSFIRKKFPEMKYVDIDSGDGESRDVATHHIDLCDLPFADNSFDLSICSHVLEHIPDDRKAITELYRVMKPGCRALVLVPIFYDLKKTFEDPHVVSPKQRKKLFGQDDHVRKCGRDYWDRLCAAGFKAEMGGYFFRGTEAEARFYQMNRGMTEKDFEGTLNFFVK